MAPSWSDLTCHYPTDRSLAPAKSIRMRKVKLQHTDKEELIREHRELFLSYIDELAPEVLESLKNLIPLYEELIDRAPSGGHMAGWLNGATALDRDHPNYDDIREELTRRFLEIRIKQREVDYTRISEIRDSLWETFLALRNGFTDFLKSYNLNTEWLREEYWRYLVQLAAGKKLSRGGALMVDTPDRPLPEGPWLELQIDGWQIEEDWPVFEERARKEFENALKDYQVSTMKQFSAQGNKRRTKPPNIGSVRWLVLWTVKGMSKDDILAEIDQENPDRKQWYDIKSLEAAFRKLKTYGLPTR